MADVWKEREADSYARRRNAQDREFKKDFDSYYGKQQADGTMGGSRRKGTGAGKGDATRPVNKLMFDIGYELSFGDLTDERREELTALWERCKQRIRS